MKVKFIKDMSSLEDFKSEKFKGHKYLRATFVAASSNTLRTMALGNNAYMVLNIMPIRNNAVDENWEKMLINAFSDGTLERTDQYVDRFPITVEPFLMKYSSDNANGKKGEIIKDGLVPRVYDYINIVAFCAINDKGEEIVDANGKPVPADARACASRALSVKRYRIKNGDWIDYAEWQKQSNSTNLEPSDDNIPAEPDAKQDDVETERKRLQEQLAALSQPNRIQLIYSLFAKNRKAISPSQNR